MFTNHFDAAIYRDRVRLTNARTGMTLDHNSDRPFSSERRFIADREAAFAFLKALLRESDGKARLLRIWVTANVSLSGEQSSPADRDDVQQLFVELGFTKVRVS